MGNQLNHSKIIELHCGNTLQPLKSDSEAYKCFPHFDHISWNVSHKLKISNRNDRESTKPLKKKIIELHCGNTLQPLKSDSEAYKCFFLISIISPEMLVTNWKLVTGMIGNQLNHSKIIELHCGNTLQPLKSDSEAYKCFYLIFLISIISSEMLVTNWKLVTGMIGNQLNHSKIIELHCGNTLQPLKKVIQKHISVLFFSSFRSYLLKC